MKDRRQRVGKHGETLARRHLEAVGYSILETNYRTASGELDLVAVKDETLVFVEVRTRSGAGFGLPQESVTHDKRSRLVAASQEYLQANQAEEREWRIDVVALEVDTRGRPVRLNVIENAVEV